jgi:hypothetical protein
VDVRFEPVDRSFTVGAGDITLRHAGDLWLEPDELVTVRTEAGGELDVTRKSWGFYATPSLNRRLREHGLRATLATGVDGATLFVLLVEDGREEEFLAYVAAQRMRVVCWLDDDAAAAEAVARLDADR